jgi:hypothetical protein
MATCPLLITKNTRWQELDNKFAQSADNYVEGGMPSFSRWGLSALGEAVKRVTDIKSQYDSCFKTL